jgi:hypothetical protein
VKIEVAHHLSPMHIAFTGTQDGLQVSQRDALWRLLEGVKSIMGNAVVGHHGDCIGGDAQFDQVCASLGVRREAHPGCDRSGASPKRAYCQAEVVHELMWYIDRNHVIVGLALTLIACPGGYTEELRSGTWATIRHARKLRRTVVLVYPDGRIDVEVGDLGLTPAVS